MAYRIDETVVLTTEGEATIVHRDGSEHLLQRHKVQSLEIRDERVVDGRREIAFKWIRGFHHEGFFTGVGCKRETMHLAVIDGALMMQSLCGALWGPVLAVLGATERAVSAGLDLALLDGTTGETSFIPVDGGVLIDDFDEVPKFAQEKTTVVKVMREAIAYATGALDPETVLLSIIPEDMDLTEIGNTNGSALRWHKPEAVLHMSRKFGLDWGDIVARTTYGNIADPVAMAANDDTGGVIDLSKVMLPSMDSIGWDTPAGDDQRTLAQACETLERWVA